MMESRGKAVGEAVMLLLLSVVMSRLGIASFIATAPLLLFAIRHGRKSASLLLAAGFAVNQAIDLVLSGGLPADSADAAFLLLNMYIPLSLSAAGIVWLYTRGRRLMGRLFLTLLPAFVLAGAMAAFFYSDRALFSSVLAGYEDAFAALLGPMISVLLPGADIGTIAYFAVLVLASLVFPILLCSVCASCFIFETGLHSRESGWEEKVMRLEYSPDAVWGFIIFAEVHMLPAPVFRITAELQAIHRLGLTATLVREDGREDEVFSLVGPKRYDTPWSELEAQGFIAKAYCHEIRLPLPEDLEIKYAIAKKREKYRIAAENPLKIEAAKRIIKAHEGDSILIIGQYLEQLEEFRSRFGYPIITGSTPARRRDELYALFREGKEKVLIVSKVANSAIDLPDASVAIQISGTFGSRQEEAQRLGRILRPKAKDSHFYTLVTEYTEEEDFAQNRQKFLSEQGYSYSIEKAEQYEG